MILFGAMRRRRNCLKMLSEMEARWELLNLGSQDLTEGRDRYQEVKWTWCFDLTRIVPTTVLKYLLFYGRSRSIVNKSKHQI